MVAVILALHMAPVTIRTSFLGLKNCALHPHTACVSRDYQNNQQLSP